MFYLEMFKKLVIFLFQRCSYSKMFTILYEIVVLSRNERLDVKAATLILFNHRWKIIDWLIEAKKKHFLTKYDIKTLHDHLANIWFFISRHYMRKKSKWPYHEKKINEKIFLVAFLDDEKWMKNKFNDIK